MRRIKDEVRKAVCLLISNCTMQLLLSTFNKFSTDEQVDFALSKGNYVSEISKFNITMRLFDCRCFYVEIWSQEPMGTVFQVRAFDDMQELEPYLEQVDLRELGLPGGTA